MRNEEVGMKNEQSTRFLIPYYIRSSFLILIAHSPLYLRNLKETA
jgi:hypothetical protein